MTTETLQQTNERLLLERIQQLEAQLSQFQPASRAHEDRKRELLDQAAKCKAVVGSLAIKLKSGSAHATEEKLAWWDAELASISTVESRRWRFCSLTGRVQG